MALDERQSVLETNFKLLHEQYQQIKKIQKLDSSAEKEEARANPSEEMENLIDQMIDEIDSMMILDSPLHLRLLAMKTTLLYERSKLLISLGEEKLAREVLVTALDGINDTVSRAEIIFLAFRIINHYAYLLSKQGEFDKPKELLELAELTYNNLKKQDPIISFYLSDDLFAPDSIITPTTDSNNKLERLVTNNLQMLGFIYNKQELHDKFAEYHHEVLRRQLEMHDGDVTLWAVKSARLASYFLSKNKFKEARHHLAAAIYVLYNYEKELKSMEPSDNMIAKWEDLQHKFADIAKCWVKYGLFLFSVSKTNIVSFFCGEPNQILEKLWASPFKNSDKNNPSTSKETPLKDTSSDNKDADVPIQSFGDTAYEDICSTASSTLPNLLENMQQNETVNVDRINVEEYQGPLLFFDLPNLFEYEEQVTASFVETTAHARALFLYTHSWLKRVKIFYTLQDYPMEYINAILDLSELYRYLAFYEEDIESQYAVQKLRADALETLSAVLREVRPQCYTAVSVELLRELAEVQLEMMGLNLRRIYVAQENVPDSSAVTLHKMEALADIHSRLEQFGDNLGHNIDPSDIELMPVSDMAGDVCQYVNI